MIKFAGKTRKDYILLLSLLFLVCLTGRSQTLDTEYISGSDSSEVRLLQLASDNPTLQKSVNISVADIPLTEFIRAIASSSGANISIDSKINTTIVNSFNNVRVVDVLIFLKRQYNLEISSIGNIIMIKPGIEPKIEYTNEIKYDNESGLLTYEIDGASLGDVSKKITLASKKNIILESGSADLPVKALPLTFLLKKHLFNLPFQMILSTDLKNPV